MTEKSKASEKIRTALVRRQLLIFISLSIVGIGLMIGSQFINLRLLSEGIAFIIVGFVGIMMSWTTMDIGTSIKEAVYENGVQNREFFERTSASQDKTNATLDRIDASQAKTSATLDRIDASQAKTSATLDKISATLDRINTSQDKMSATQDKTNATLDKTNATLDKMISLLNDTGDDIKDIKDTLQKQS